MKNKISYILIAIGGIVSVGHFFLISPLMAADPFPIPITPTPVGSGARAMGMGGAFIAIADDATAASWNPGGLIQLEESEISIVVDYINRTEDNEVIHPYERLSGSQSIYKNNLDYMSVAFPFTVGQSADKNMIISLNYQRLYDFDRQWIFNDGRYTMQGSLYALGIAYSIKITDYFSFGFTLNDWGEFLDDNKLEIQSKSSDTDTTTEYVFKGRSINIGFLFRMGENLTIGGVFKSPFTADIRYKFNNNSIIGCEGCGQSERLYLNMPMSYGFGLAWRLSDKFIISLDCYRTVWDNFMMEDTEGNKISAFSSNLSPTNSFRIGTEYLIFREKSVVPIRGGFFYDPAPAKNSTDELYGFSLGTGISYDALSFDIAYQLHIGNNVGNDPTIGLDSQDIKEHQIYASLIYYFKKRRNL